MSKYPNNLSTQSNFDRITRQGLTYDDVLLVLTFLKFFRETLISCPTNSNTQVEYTNFGAAMDTVSEYRMAIALAREGGIAMLHKNMTIENQGASSIS